MYLVYLGESGNTGSSLNDPNQPHHVHVGLLVHESQSLSMNAEFNVLFGRHFGQVRGAPGSLKGFRPAELYQGVGAFASWPATKRDELIQDCLGLLTRRQTPLILAYLGKREFAAARAGGDHTAAAWGSPSEPIISRLLLALSMLVDELNMEGLDSQQLKAPKWPITDFALVVAGEGRSVKPWFMTQFLRSEDGMDATSVLENFCFVGLEHSVGNQLANMCAYFARRWLQNPAASHPYFDTLKDGNVVQVIYPVQV